MKIKEKNKLIPKLRFPEFKDSGEWKIKPLRDLLDYERPDMYIVKDTNYSNEGIPVLTANKSFILGYTKEKFGVYKNLPAIIFDDFTVENKFVDFPFKVKSSAIKILTAKKNDNLKFIYELISQIKFDAVQHKRYYISQYQNLKVPIPSLPEQQKIAAFLSNLDELIEAHKQKLELLKKHKKGLMQNLFPQEGEKVPKLRFPEFKDSGEWNLEILGSLTEIKGRIGYRGYTRADIVEKGKGAITLSPTNFDENGKLNFENSTYISWEKYEESPEIMLEEGDTVLVKTASVGKCAYVENLPEKTTINPQIVVLKPRKINPKFLSYSIFHTYVQNQIKKYIGVGAIPNMSQASIAKINILLPPKEEQKKIADILSSLDELIDAEEKKIEQLERHKKGLMQGLFPEI